MISRLRLSAVLVALLFAFAVSLPPAFAAGEEEPTKPEPKSDTKKDDTKKDESKKDESKKTKKDEKKSELDFINGYHAARALVEGKRYEAGLAAFKALGHDDNPAVATYIGFAYRKLGHFDQAKTWYDRALAADPRQVRTLEYYGEWHVERGNLEMAKLFLAKIRVICGNTSCEEYKTLKLAIAGKPSNWN